ncbi:hypothetical protein AGR4A_Cc20224 [Agrobacterium tumefaciens str. B6]|uniref:Uncharacterized protein n=2 Tax=Agrobacterium tumefaciens TaxID=358 RepID=A0A822UZF3_AGRTU|nr:hypothetical protein AGR4C_Cc180036 [Agrobacterium tumefaciens str. Kerr 14]CVI16345.1 hypothetical protein AGR4A_Cc20224 [Agrobacterium tumefaciens str. B6]
MAGERDEKLLQDMEASSHMQALQ